MSASYKHIQFRRGTQNDLDKANPILKQGESAFATDTNVLKIGDGQTRWRNLPEFVSTRTFNTSAITTTIPAITNGNTAFVLLSGKVQITRRIDGKIKPVGIVNAGGMFGEMALIDDAARMATARVVGASAEALVVSRRIFEEKLESADPFLRALITILAKRVRPTVSK